MKPLSERKIYVDYMSGKQIPAHDFNDGGLDIFSDYVWPEVLKEHATRQKDFDGEVWYQKTRPIHILTPNQEHFLRDKTNPLTDEQKLAYCRYQLAIEMQK